MLEQQNRKAVMRMMRNDDIQYSELLYSSKLTLTLTVIPLQIIPLIVAVTV